MVANAEQEIEAAMNSAAIVDRSFFGRIMVTGADRLDLLHRLSTNSLVHLKPYSSTGTVFTNDKGRIVDYVRVIVRPDDLVLITSPGYEERVKLWIDKYTIMEDVQVSIITHEMQMLSLFGPNALSVAGVIFPQIPSPNQNCSTHVEGMTIVLDNQEEFSMSCLNILLQNAGAEQQRDLYEAVLQRCTQLNANTYDCFRIINGIPGGMTELTEAFNPFDVGLRHSISFTKGCYIGQEVIARLDTYQKAMRGLILVRLDQAISFPNEQLHIYKESQEIGVLTSAAETSYQSSYPALGVVKVDKVRAGDMIVVKAQPSDIKGIVQTVFEHNPS